MPLSAPLRFKDFLHDRPAPSGIDVHCKLQHFAIVTYAIDPERFRGLIPTRFSLDTIVIEGKEKELISVVPFVDVDFTSAVFPFLNFTMGQTNYRVYVVDTLTRERCVWFLGTTLDSWTVLVPNFFWNLPWYSGKVEFDCEFDYASGTYRKYKMNTKAKWAPARLELTQSTDTTLCLAGFPDIETGLVFLTHPLAGFYHRRDNRLGTYRVWHKQLSVRPASLASAYFGLLSRMGLIPESEQQYPHSVLVEPLNEFTIYLPPKIIE